MTMPEAAIHRPTRRATTRIRTRTTVALAVAALIPAACATAGTRAGEQTPPNALWTETVEIRLDEMFITSDRALEVTPIRIGVDSATFTVRSEGLERDIRLQSTGPLSSETVPPYHVRLVRTSAEPSATIQISKLRD